MTTLYDVLRRPLVTEKSSYPEQQAATSTSSRCR